MSDAEAHAGHRSVSGGLARASVFGFSDGLVSNVSLMLGFAGSGVDASIVRLAGLAGAVAGAISMAAGEWVSVSSQNDLIERELAVERRELDRNADLETEELAELYRSQGMDDETARQAADAVMRDPRGALGVHARAELGIDPDDLPSPLAVAWWSFLSFALGAVLPLLPWYAGDGRAATIASLAISLVAATLVGGVVARLAERPVAFGAARQVVIVLVACGVTYLIGSVVGLRIDG